MHILTSICYFVVVVVSRVGGGLAKETLIGATSGLGMFTNSLMSLRWEAEEKGDMIESQASLKAGGVLTKLLQVIQSFV